MNENFADGKKPGRKGLSKRVGVSQKMSISQLEKIAKNSTGERKRMAQWNLNMKRGRKKMKKEEAKLPNKGFSRKEDMIMYEEGEMCNRCAADLLKDIQEGVYNDTISKVKLNKPMRGDVKKFKVYVKDPKTGNVKKVNFGHGGTSAKKAGQKTMRIRKNNPKARKSFRARHNCDNPGPKTKARYWSCRKW
jgi:hypothetical protein